MNLTFKDSNRKICWLKFVKTHKIQNFCRSEKPQMKID